MFPAGGDKEDSGAAPADPAPEPEGPLHAEGGVSGPGQVAGGGGRRGRSSQHERRVLLPRKVSTVIVE